MDAPVSKSIREILANPNESASLTKAIIMNQNSDEPIVFKHNGKTIEIVRVGSESNGTKISIEKL